VRCGRFSCSPTLCENVVAFFVCTFRHLSCNLSSRLLKPHSPPSPHTQTKNGNRLAFIAAGALLIAWALFALVGAPLAPAGAAAPWPFVAAVARRDGQYYAYLAPLALPVAFVAVRRVCCVCGLCVLRGKAAGGKQNTNHTPHH
jgi:hypothetical protein